MRCKWFSAKKETHQYIRIDRTAKKREEATFFRRWPLFYLLKTRNCGCKTEILSRVVSINFFMVRVKEPERSRYPVSQQVHDADEDIAICF
ncbi:hypothetical protein DN748_13140 [Sinomicrobium soli]|nr:hypothetical protein DN748_13140 [Sinomicrobium sp. N-1-3-6]